MPLRSGEGCWPQPCLWAAMGVRLLLGLGLLLGAELPVARDALHVRPKRLPKLARSEGGTPDVPARCRGGGRGPSSCASRLTLCKAESMAGGI